MKNLLLVAAAAYGAYYYMNYLQKKKKAVAPVAPSRIPTGVPATADTPEVATSRSIELNSGNGVDFTDESDDMIDILTGPLDVSDYVNTEEQKNLGRYMSGAYFDIA